MTESWSRDRLKEEVREAKQNDDIMGVLSAILFGFAVAFAYSPSPIHDSNAAGLTLIVSLIAAIGWRHQHKKYLRLKSRL